MQYLIRKWWDKLARRQSQHSLEKLGKVGRKPFLPDLKEWSEVCRIYPYDVQIFHHFDISRECFYAFLDKQRCLEDQGKKSEYIDAYKRERSKTKKIVLDNLLNAAKNGDTSAIIFSSKTYGGLIEAKDIKNIELKKKEVVLKTNAFLSELAKKFELNPNQLEEFAKTYFDNFKNIETE